MLKSSVIFVVGALVGGLAGAYWFYDAGVASRDARVSVHTVRELVGNQSYADVGTYTDTRLIVYLEGNEGSDVEVLCQFAHGSFDPERVPEKVQIGPVSKKLGFGRQGYFCEAASGS